MSKKWPTCPEHKVDMIWHEDGLFVCPYIGIACGWHMPLSEGETKEDYVKPDSLSGR